MGEADTEDVCGNLSEHIFKKYIIKLVPEANMNTHWIVPRLHRTQSIVTHENNYNDAKNQTAKMFDPIMNTIKWVDGVVACLKWKVRRHERWFDDHWLSNARTSRGLCRY